MNINRYMVLGALITFAATAKTELAEIQREFKEAVAGHLKIMAEDASEITYWKNELNPETQRMKNNARSNIWFDTNEKIEARKKALLRFVQTQKAHKPWLKDSPLLDAKINAKHDPILKALEKIKQFIHTDMQRAAIEKKLIKEIYLPNAQMVHMFYAQKLAQFDIHWIKRQLKGHTDRINGFEKLYATRKADIEALKAGELLNERSLDQQCTLIGTNRGVQKIRVDKHDVSIAYYEQNNFGTPDKPFNAQELFKVQ